MSEPEDGDKGAGQNNGSKWPLEGVLTALRPRIVRPAVIIAFVFVGFVILAWVLGLGDLVKKGGLGALLIVVAIVVITSLAMILGALVGFMPVFRDLAGRGRAAESRAAQAEEQAAQSAAKMQGAEQRLRTQETRQPFEESVRQVVAGAARVEGADHVLVWSRLVPRIKLAEEIREELAGQLNHIRDVAYTRLGRILGGAQVAERSLRANIFLPDTRAAEAGEVCGLFIPKGLHVNMQNPDELKLVFRPNEGLVGKVFATQGAEGAYYDAGSKEWVRVCFRGQQDAPGDGPDYRLTDYQKALIDKSLKWVVALPLLVPDGTGSAAVGVVNVDCLNTAITPAQMKELFYEIVDLMPALGATMNKAMLDRVAIVLQASRSSK